jgi:hypothetical protein
MNEEEKLPDTERPQPAPHDTTPGMPAVGWDEPEPDPEAA